MSSKVKMWLTLVIGLIIIAITLVLFLLGFSDTEKTALNWLAMSFMLISEVLLIAGLMLLPVYIKNTSGTFASSGVYSTLFGYWLITAILAIFAKAFFNDNVRSFISTQLIVLGSAAIIIIVLFMTASNVKRDDDRITKGAVLLKNSENIAFSLMSNTEYQQFTGILGKLYEEFKYSNKNTEIADTDQQVYSAMSELAEELNKDEVDNRDIEKKVNSIILHLKERNRAVTQISG